MRWGDVAERVQREMPEICYPCDLHTIDYVGGSSSAFAGEVDKLYGNCPSWVGLSRRPSAQEHINSIAAEKVYLIGRRRHSALLPRRQTLFVVSA